MSEYMEHCLYNNDFCFLDCRVPEEFYDEIVEEIKRECSYFSTEKAREIAFKARDEVEPERLRELALLTLGAAEGGAS